LSNNKDNHIDFLCNLVTFGLMNVSCESTPSEVGQYISHKAVSEFKECFSDYPDFYFDVFNFSPLANEFDTVFQLIT